MVIIDYPFSLFRRNHVDTLEKTLYLFKSGNEYYYLSLSYTSEAVITDGKALSEYHEDMLKSISPDIPMVTLLIFERKLVCFNVKCFSNALYVFERYAAAEAFYSTYIGSVHTAFFSECFLRKASLLTIAFDICAKNLDYVHIYNPPLYMIQL